jgi:hypothetical protein
VTCGGQDWPVMHLGAAHGLLDQALRHHGEFDVSD